MKKTLLTYSIDYTLIFISTLVIALVLTFLRVNNHIDNQGYEVALIVGTNVVFLIGGLFLGLKMKKRGLLNGFIFAIIYTLFALLFNFLAMDKFGWQDTLNIFIRDIIVLVSCLFGVNITAKK